MLTISGSAAIATLLIEAALTPAAAAAPVSLKKSRLEVMWNPFQRLDPRIPTGHKGREGTRKEPVNVFTSRPFASFADKKDF
jgi:hypothetical protein